MRNVFITGATGFIGSHLVETLLEHGMQTKCLVRNSSNVDNLLRDGIELIQGRLDDADSYRAAVNQCDTVIHLAGMRFGATSSELDRINGQACGSLADVCRAASNPPKLIYVSSVAAAGPPPEGKELRVEDDPPEPISNYGKSKRLGEVMFQQRAADVPISVVRPGVVFGQGDSATSAMFRSIYRYRLHVVIGFKQIPPLSLIHVDDLVNMIIRTAESGETLSSESNGEFSSKGYYFAVDDSDYPTYKELGQRIAKVLDRKIFVLPMTKRFGRFVGHALHWASSLNGHRSMLDADKAREAAAPSWASSGEKARRQLGFQPAQPIDIRLQQTADWYLSQEQNGLKNNGSGMLGRLIPDFKLFF